SSAEEPLLDANTVQANQELEQEQAKRVSLAALEKAEKDTCRTFKLSYLPPILHNYVQALCQTTNAHPIMITSAVLSTVAAFLQKRAYIEEGEYFQRLYPNLWMLNISKSGQFKSTALNKGARLAW